MMACPQAHAQLQNNNWFFGEQNGISFANGTPSFLDGGQNARIEGGAVVSDQNGQLLFYTDAYDVWNNQHRIMPGGPLHVGYGFNTQSSLIIPKPGNAQQYYIFTIIYNAGNYELEYHLVDMTLDAGRGDIVLKNRPLKTRTCQKLTAVLHCNKTDYWVITHEVGSDAYYSWLVTSAGVSANPVISHTGLVVPANNLDVIVGYLRASPDGKHLVAAHRSLGVDLCDFDKYTGIVSNATEIFQNAAAEHYGVEFSASSQKLYLGINNYWDPVKGQRATGLFQYDMSQPSVAAIIASKYKVFEYEGYVQIGPLVRGPDNKLYLTHYRTGSLSVINDPEKPGAAVGYVDIGFLLHSFGLMNLPNFPNAYPAPPPDFTVSPLSICAGNEITVRYAGSENIKWVFDDPSSGSANNAYTANATHAYATTGPHTIALIVMHDCGNDTVYKRVNVYAASVQLGNDTSICAEIDFTISLNNTGYVYQWQDGSTSNSYAIKAPGWYWVDARRTDIGCVARDSILISQVSPPVVSLGKDTVLCAGERLLLDAMNPGASFLWQDNSQAQTKMVNGPGLYAVAVTAGGCTTRDSILITGLQLPAFSLGPDQPICPGNPVVLQPQGTADNYLWQDGSITTSFTVSQPGLYYATATNQCGAVTDSVVFVADGCNTTVPPVLAVPRIPNAFTPNHDGYNDVFRVRGVESMTSFSLRIFNRWGQPVFASTDKTKGWDGCINGKDAPVGIYIFTLHYSTNALPAVQVLKGSVVLIR